MLQENPDLTQREIAERLGLSASGLNYCLRALIEKGWVKVQNFSESKNKFGYIYVLTPLGISQKISMTGKFLRRKMQEYDALKAEVNSLSQELSTAEKIKTDGSLKMRQSVNGHNIPKPDIGV